MKRQGGGDKKFVFILVKYWKEKMNSSLGDS